MLRHSSKRSCPGYHGQPWPITGSRCWTRLTERWVPPLHPAPLPPHPASSPAQLVLPTLHAQTQTYTTTRINYGLVSCFKAASVSVGKKSPSLSKWVTGAQLDAASTSTTIGAGRWDKRCAERGAGLRNFFCGGGASATTSGLELLTVIALLVTSPSEASLPLPLPLSHPLSLHLSLPPGESPTPDWGSPAGLDESSTSTAMRRCSLVDHIGKMHRALPSPSGMCPGGTYPTRTVVVTPRRSMACLSMVVTCDRCHLTNNSLLKTDQHVLLPTFIAPTCRP